MTQKELPNFTKTILEDNKEIEDEMFKYIDDSNIKKIKSDNDLYINIIKQYIIKLDMTSFKKIMDVPVKQLLEKYLDDRSIKSYERKYINKIIFNSNNNFKSFILESCFNNYFDTTNLFEYIIGTLSYDIDFIIEYIENITFNINKYKYLEILLKKMYIYNDMENLLLTFIDNGYLLCENYQNVDGLYKFFNCLNIDESIIITWNIQFTDEWKLNFRDKYYKKIHDVKQLPTCIIDIIWEYFEDMCPLCNTLHNKKDFCLIDKDIQPKKISKKIVSKTISPSVFINN